MLTSAIGLSHSFGWGLGAACCALESIVVVTNEKMESLSDPEAMVFSSVPGAGFLASTGERCSGMGSSRLDLTK